jgi:hypothetical protein
MIQKIEKKRIILVCKTIMIQKIEKKRIILVPSVVLKFISSQIENQDCEIWN